PASRTGSLSSARLPGRAGRRWRSCSPPSQAKRVGLQPAEAGRGNFPAAPEYLPPPMPWPAVRHKSDEDRWAIVAYLKHGIKPVSSVVPDGEGPPDHWASAYTPDAIGPYPFPAFPAGGETFTP